MTADMLQERRRKTEFVLSNIYNLPGRSEIMGEALRALDDPNTSGQSISRLICRDQGIATKILSIANSPLYGLNRRVSTIEFAIMIIGFAELKKIILALSIMESFKNKTDRYLDQKEFWTHSILTANMSRRIAEDLGFKNSGEAFVAGFLHDLGIPAMHKYFHTGFVEIVENTRLQNGLSVLEAEKDILGMDHQEIGGYLAEKWELPVLLSDSITYHHRPSAAIEDKGIAAVVHLADHMTQKYNHGQLYRDDTIPFDTCTAGILNFNDNEQLNKFIYHYQDLFRAEIATLKF